MNPALAGAVKSIKNAVVNKILYEFSTTVGTADFCTECPAPVIACAASGTGRGPVDYCAQQEIKIVLADVKEKRPIS